MGGRIVALEGEEATRYEPRVTYAYTVRWRRFEGEAQAAPPGVTFATREGAAAALRPYRAGEPVRVAYDRRDPVRSVLVRPDRRQRPGPILAGAASILLGLALAALGLRRRRPRSSAGPAAGAPRAAAPPPSPRGDRELACALCGRGGGLASCSGCGEAFHVACARGRGNACPGCAGPLAAPPTGRASGRLASHRASSEGWTRLALVLLPVGLLAAATGIYYAAVVRPAAAARAGARDGARAALETFLAGARSGEVEPPEGLSLLAEARDVAVRRLEVLGSDVVHARLAVRLEGDAGGYPLAVEVRRGDDGVWRVAGRAEAGR